MAKTKTLYKCQKCEFESPQWLGKCTNCDSWNSLEEVLISKEESVAHRNVEAPSLSKKDHERLVKLDKFASFSDNRLKSNINEFDRVLGGGIFEGSVTLFSGEPGIGKSTLLLQAANGLAKDKLVLYVSAEESLGQITSRAKRLKIDNNNLIVLAENNLLTILGFLKEIKPSVLILDSIQAVYHPEISQPTGSMTQVRDSAAILERSARESGCALFIVGHVTKEGFLAGPKTLEHLVDTVIYFEGDRYQNLRTLRAVKNRNGSTGEMGLFEMTECGLEQIINPSELFMGDGGSSPGRALVPLMEGDRPLIAEVQALVTPTVYPNPVRRFTGVDTNQASLLVAIIEKTLKLNLSKSDLFIKISGGLNINETACDLAITLAIISSFLNKELPSGYALIGELGLGGEVRPVKALEARVRECERLGLKHLILPDQKMRGELSSLKATKVKSLSSAYQTLMRG